MEEGKRKIKTQWKGRCNDGKMEKKDSKTSEKREDMAEKLTQERRNERE